MRQFIGSIRDRSTVRDLLVSLAPAPLRAAADALDTAELAMMETEDEPTQLRYAQALADWADVGGYEAETVWDVATVAALGIAVRGGAVARAAHPVRWRAEAAGAGGAAARPGRGAAARRAGQLPRRARPSAGWRSGLSPPRRPCCSSPTTGSCWPARRTASSPSSPAPPARPRGCTAAGSTATTRPGRSGLSRLEELRRRWDEEHAKLKALVLMYKTKAAYNDGLASRYQAAQTRLREVRGGRAAAAGAADAAGERCGCAAGGRASGRWSASGWS